MFLLLEDQDNAPKKLTSFVVAHRTDVRGSMGNNFLLGFQESVTGKKTVQVDQGIGEFLALCYKL